MKIANKLLFYRSQSIIRRTELPWLKWPEYSHTLHEVDNLIVTDESRVVLTESRSLFNEIFQRNCETLNILTEAIAVRGTVARQGGARLVDPKRQLHFHQHEIEGKASPARCWGVFSCQREEIPFVLKMRGNIL